jgi:hypothetical protein
VAASAWAALIFAIDDAAANDGMVRRPGLLCRIVSSLGAVCFDCLIEVEWLATNTASLGLVSNGRWPPVISQACVPKPPASGLARDADGLVRRLRRRKPVEFGTAGQASADEVRTRLQVRMLSQALP